MPKNLQAEFQAAQAGIEEVLALAEKEERGLTDDEQANLKQHEDAKDAAKKAIEGQNAVKLARQRHAEDAKWATSPGARLSTPNPLVLPGASDFKVPAFLRNLIASSGSLVSFTGPDALDQAHYAGQWYAATLFKRRSAAKWCEAHGLSLDWEPDNESLTATEGVDAKGGYLVPTFLSNAIIRLRETYGVFRANADVVPMSTETYQVPRETGDVTAYFVGEGTEITASDSKYDAITLTARKIAALCKISSELAEDAFASMADRVTRSIAYAFAKLEDDCGFLGTGTYATYGGITGLITAVGEGSEVTAATTHITYALMTLTDFESMLGKLPSYVRDIKWYIHKTAAWASMFRLQDAAGGNQNAQIAGGPMTATFLGFPVVFCPSMNSTLTTNASTEGLCYVGDMRQAVKFGDRRGITVASSADRYFEYDLLAIRATERFDINCANVGDASAAGSIVQLSAPAS